MMSPYLKKVNYPCDHPRQENAAVAKIRGLGHGSVWQCPDCDEQFMLQHNRPGGWMWLKLLDNEKHSE